MKGRHLHFDVFVDCIQELSSRDCALALILMKLKINTQIEWSVLASLHQVKLIHYKAHVAAVCPVQKVQAFMQP